MSIFRRSAPVPNLHRNPADGRQYEAAHLPNQVYGQRYAVFFTGKELIWEITDPHLVQFTDGSWVNNHTGEISNAGPGELAVSRTDPSGRPW
jgi:hypothetical protein